MVICSLMIHLLTFLQGTSTLTLVIPKPMCVHYLSGYLDASQQRLESVTMSDRKAVIKNADMSEDMQQDAVDCATQAMEKYNIEKDIAAYIKKEFDKKYNPTWHCIVGRNFGSYVTHETKHFIYFYLGQVAILLFKSG
ncbi:Dynein light chain 2, cytoplasmic [Fukomys damarensis]|uniref:Dynein light chain n=1 Tax=Fukomys damarensis TaxID=885580 RepID=A0A091EHP7_FUKDA|nr:Dynein light chain 2, cytoplasmic [Fukomys damarensis]